MIFELRHPESSATLLAFRQRGDLNGKGADILLIPDIEAVSRKGHAAVLTVGVLNIGRIKPDGAVLRRASQIPCGVGDNGSLLLCLGGDAFSESLQ